jgi:hypothetical protein
MTEFLFFLGYSAFCWWVVFWDGAEVLEGWKAGLLLGWFEATLTASELRVGTVISWIAALVILLFTYFST